MAPLPLGVLKFNVDGVMRSKSGLSGLGGVLSNSKGKVLFMFSKLMGIHDSDEAKFLAILEALHYFSRFFHSSLIVDCDSSNTITRVSNRKANPWRLRV